MTCCICSFRLFRSEACAPPCSRSAAAVEHPHRTRGSRGLVTGRSPGGGGTAGDRSEPGCGSPAATRRCWVRSASPWRRGRLRGGALRRAAARRGSREGLNRPMGEPQAAAWRRSRKCCGAFGPRCRFPLSAGARPRGLHGSGGASRRLPAAAAEELLRRPRLHVPRGPSW